MFLCDLCHCDVEWLTTSIQQVGPSSSQVNVCAVVNEWVALSHVSLQAVESAVLGNLQQAS